MKYGDAVFKGINPNDFCEWLYLVKPFWLLLLLSEAENINKQNSI